MKCPKCGWENTPESKQCLQCDAILNGPVEIPLYPPRAKKRSKFTREKTTKRLHRNGRTATDLFGFLIRHTQQTLNPAYSRILLVLIAGLIPGFIQILQRRHSYGLLLLSCALLLSLLLVVFVTNIASNFFLYLLIALILYSSYDAVTNYYQKKNYILNLIARAGIILSEVSVCLFIYSLALYVFNIWYIHITVPTDGLAPTFKKDDEIIVYRMAYKKELPQPGDIVAVRHEYANTVERIIGIPGDEIVIKEGKIFVNDYEIMQSDYPLARVPNINAAVSLPDSFYFVFVYIIDDQRGIQLVKSHLRNILGKAVLIINPPERRRFIQ